MGLMAPPQIVMVTGPDALTQAVIWRYFSTEAMEAHCEQILA